MMKHLFFMLFISIMLIGSHQNKALEPVKMYETENVVIYQLSDHTYKHISFLETKLYGKVPCNGLIITVQGEAVVFDTPPNDETSKELIDWIQKNLKCTIKAIIPAHFHEDNLGGLNAFHEQSIPSYALRQTIDLAKLNGYPVPLHPFEDKLELEVGDQKVYAEFIGEGHTKDNIIGYFPTDKVMFGGCLLKEIGSGKGNLADANVNDWSQTVRKLKLQFPEAEIIIPGHGKVGGRKLLDYTIQLFDE